MYAIIAFMIFSFFLRQIQSELYLKMSSNLCNGSGWVQKKSNKAQPSIKKKECLTWL